MYAWEADLDMFQAGHHWPGTRLNNQHRAYSLLSLWTKWTLSLGRNQET